MSAGAEPTDLNALLKRAYISLDKMQARLAAVEQAKAEPIAIIGIGCRFPGGANDPEAFWRVLRDGGDTVTAFPARRGLNPRPGDTPTEVAKDERHRWGAFLDDV